MPREVVLHLCKFDAVTKSESRYREARAVTPIMGIMIVICSVLMVIKTSDLSRISFKAVA